MTQSISIEGKIIVLSPPLEWPEVAQGGKLIVKQISEILSSRLWPRGIPHVVELSRLLVLGREKTRRHLHLPTATSVMSWVNIPRRVLKRLSADSGTQTDVYPEWSSDKHQARANTEDADVNVGIPSFLHAQMRNDP